MVGAEPTAHKHTDRPSPSTTCSTPRPREGGSVGGGGARDCCPSMDRSARLH
ncbi:hypothetical protein Scep_009311 [Stephania cephalantha]|uniref:Uncharacterized protein n=1 Tax=Stephania cephalantha TaxID=152367 RepID=A0AAP0PG49_9MAGN